MKIIAALTILAAAVLLAQNTHYTNSQRLNFDMQNVPYDARTNISWMGHPYLMYTNNNGPWPGFLTSHEIGFRGDGVVVWRQLK